jgi:hypothetical protein
VTSFVWREIRHPHQTSTSDIRIRAVTAYRQRQKASSSPEYRQRRRLVDKGDVHRATVEVAKLLVV